MTLPSYVAGCDVSKHTIDIYLSQSEEYIRIDNNEAEIHAWLLNLSAMPELFVYESTGRYHRPLSRALHKAGIKQSMINPLRSWAFARIEKEVAKTDQLDAARLSRMGQVLELPLLKEATPVQETLQAALKRRQQLVNMRTQERLRRSEHADESQIICLEEHIDFLNAAVKKLDKQIKNIINETEILQRDAELLQTIPGFGPVTITTLLALLPELGTISRRSVATLAGLAPMNRDSGKFTGKRKTAHGRKDVRRALFMAAMSAARTCPKQAAFYNNLRNKGKPVKVARIALARKMMITANAIIKSRKPYAV